MPKPFQHTLDMHNGKSALDCNGKSNSFYFEKKHKFHVCFIAISEVHFWMQYKKCIIRPELHTDRHSLKNKQKIWTHLQQSKTQSPGHWAPAA